MSSSSSTTQTIPRSGGGTPVRLNAGVYVAARALAMDFPASMGAHQFVFVVWDYCPIHPDAVTDGGHSFMVLGAYNQSGRLQPAKNAQSDVAALVSYLNGVGELDIARVNVSTPVDSSVTMLTMGYDRYVAHERLNPITYPASGGATLTGCATTTTYNSNSWAQSLVHHRLGPGLVRQDFAGIDICHANLIPAAYFQ